MNNNFSVQEFNHVESFFIVNNLPVKLRINKAENINVDNLLRSDEHFVLYHNKYGYFWRHFDNLNKYSYPLNMKDRKKMRTETYTYFDGSSYQYQIYKTYDHCCFSTLEEALDYFVKYFKTHQNKKSKSNWPRNRQH